MACITVTPCTTWRFKCLPTLLLVRELALLLFSTRQVGRSGLPSTCSLLRNTRAPVPGVRFVLLLWLGLEMMFLWLGLVAVAWLGYDVAVAWLGYDVAVAVACI